MKKKSDEKLSKIIEGYKSVYLDLYGLDKFDFENDEQFKKFVSSVEDYSKLGFDSFDVEMSISYRLGKVNKADGTTRHKKAGSICTLATRGITLPEEVVWFEISAKPVFKNKGSNLVFKQTTRKNPLFEQKILVAKDYDFEKIQAKEGDTVYKISDKVQVHHIDDLKDFCKLVTFKKNNEIEI